MAREELGQTRVAFIGTSFARTFANEFYETDVSGFAPFLQEPETQSTGGGARARQPMFLRQANGSQTIAIGWVNVATKESSLKSYGCLLAQHKQRYADKPMPIDEASYKGFLAQVEKFFGQRAIKVEYEERPVERTSRPPPARRAEKTLVEVAKDNALYLALGGVGLLIAIGLLFFILRH